MPFEPNKKNVLFYGLNKIKLFFAYIESIAII